MAPTPLRRAASAAARTRMARMGLGDGRAARGRRRDRPRDRPSDAQSPLLRWFQDLRTPALVDVAKFLDGLTDPLIVWILRVVILVVAALFARWRHLFTLLALYVVVDFLDTILAVQRPAPEGVTVLSNNAATAFPSLPVAALAVTLFGAAMVLARPAGHAGSRGPALSRSWGWWCWRGSCSRRTIRSTRCTRCCSGGSPSRSRSRSSSRRTSFPVSYARGGKAAHLDLAGARGDAIVAAVRDQLGFTVTEIEPFGLAGSGGSSPLRMRVAEARRHLFGKIYATSHLRADRWYKVGRTILYGQLEDEVPLGSVRRLALYEDYALRLLRDVGIARRDHLRHRRAHPGPRVHARDRVLLERDDPRRRRGRRRDHRRGDGACAAALGLGTRPPGPQAREHARPRRPPAARRRLRPRRSAPRHGGRPSTSRT